MDVQAVSGAATIAVASTVAFFAVARLWQLLQLSMPRSHSFGESIMRESADRLRHELNRLSQKQLTYAGGGIAFLLFFATGFALNARQLYADYPLWQLNLLLAVAALIVAFGLYKMLRTFIEWRRLSFQRDANMSIGHGLHRVASENGRVYHDVETPEGTIDHVLVGIKGIYAVHVVARHAGKDASVAAEAGKLRFSNSDEATSVAGMRKMNSALSRELSAAADTDIKVRLVVAVPGWEIRSQSDGSLLLVNERNLPMIRGWRDTSEFLLNDVVAAINHALTARCCVAAPRRSAQAK